MRIGRYTGHPIQSEIERWQWIAGSFHKRHQKSTQTCIDMNRNIIFDAKRCNGPDIVHSTVWEVWCRSNKLKRDINTHTHTTKKEKIFIKYIARHEYGFLVRCVLVIKTDIFTIIVFLLIFRFIWMMSTLVVSTSTST